jgi:hypothetical protein
VNALGQFSVRLIGTSNTPRIVGNGHQIEWLVRADPPSL